ncbi:alpha/beta-hydrolase [Lojkania enalia]|uniref:Carboxylic ester hydrolase n=1 Tax=Lojkania enalia TaxID=147567 RepID=A0A9P4NBU4_9PLEO|nr:alpha/beta-hydrolase [Didymosphaeria enalia]
MVSLKLGAFFSLWSYAVLAFPYSSPNDSSYPPFVQTKNGTIEGVYSAVHNQDFFLGIPYAQPPVGALRFRVPQPLNTKFSSTYSATEYSAACVGYGSDEWPYPFLSEDCLYLNVIRPANYSDQKLPVAFWIHGGGLYEGSAIDERYNLTWMVKRSVEIGKPIIAVSVNYRLSMWGFITGEEVIKSGNANLGFRDQRLGLHWVQENIEAFGGDPSKVTIFGESAGGLSVGMHLTAYGGRDDKLFRGAIMQSGSPISYSTLDYDPSELLTASVQLGCNNSSSILDCLRTISYDTLNAWINSTASYAFSWQPIIDGDFIQGKTSLQLDSGAFVHVPIISGANSDEGTAFGPKPINTAQDFYNYLINAPAPAPAPLTPSQATKVLSAYPANITVGAVPTNQPLSYIPGPGIGASSRRSDAYAGDVAMIAPRRKTCQTWASASLSAYCYRFNTIPAGLGPETGATHFQEVAFVFNNKLGGGYGYPGVSVNPFEGMPQKFLELSDEMSAAWVAFVHDLSPGEWWPRYEGEIGRNWVFDANATGLGYRELDDWRKEGIELISGWNAEIYRR